ncbi:hypothetical protein [Leucobacter sp. M11]|uniref:hypothetical protein n=1 Tax=Leucobacter sp. M11 TaxID=2993565 RepID=UPI002D7FAAF2|nr:hypothetical protein [Leucobacter sp. M11]MEB4616519.1 hypothetical protein [Leucobacter sp. M11]
MKTFPERGVTVALLGLMTATIASIWWPPGSLLAGVCALVLIPFALRVAERRTRLICLLLLSLGGAAMLAGSLLDRDALQPALLGRLNQDLIAMMTGVAFVRLAVQTDGPNVAVRLRGVPGLVRTAVVTQVLGSILNMVALGIVGDRLARRGSLSLADANLVARSYAIAALWSPFWVVSAVILATVPAANLGIIGVIGAAAAVLFLLLSTLQNARTRGPELRDEPGFPFSARLLIVPALLCAVVVAGHAVLPGTPVPRLVLLAAILVPLAVLLVGQGPRTALRRFRVEGIGQLPRSANEALLFVSAGVLSVGLAQLIEYFGVSIPGTAFTPWHAWGVTIAIVLGSLVGLHPLIAISVIAGLVLPLHPEPTLLGVAIAFGWGIAAPVGPISGVTVVLAQRYGVSNRAMVLGNLPYAAIGIVLALGAVWAAGVVTGVVSLPG